jgi:hypothetical protein
MAHQYAVGVKDQAPLLFVVAATASPALARVRYTELEGRATGSPASSDRPIFTRVTAAGVAPTAVVPEPLDPFSPASQYQGEHTYGVPPTTGTSSAGYPEIRSGYGQKVRYGPNSGLVIPDDCPLAVVADATANWEWDVNIVFEEL